MAMFIKDDEKDKFLNEIFKEVDENPNSTDLMTNLETKNLEKLGIKFKKIEQTKV